MDTPATSLLATKYTKTNIKDIPTDGAVHPMTARGNSTHFTEMTKAVFEPGKGMDWHTHATEDEMMIILQGTGKFYWKEELTDYTDGDIFRIPANTLHKISASGQTPTQVWYIRTKV